MTSGITNGEFTIPTKNVRPGKRLNRVKANAGGVTSKVWLVAVFAFLYLPIVTLVVLSFNDSSVITSWGGWTLRWYEDLAQDVEIISGFKLSLKIAFLTACSSVVLGTLAALALTRFKPTAEI